jgi:hypothetical protein
MSKNFQVIHSESYVGDKLQSISVNESAEPFVYNVAASEVILRTVSPLFFSPSN